MVAVSGPVVSVELVEQVLGEVSGSLGPVVVAAVNAPTVVVISGARAAVEAAAARLSAVGCGTRSLSVSHAFHSPLLDPVLEDFRQVAAGVGVCAGEVGLVSNVSGGLADVGEGFGSAEYWVRHARQAVRFADAIGFAAARGADRFVELGPGALVSAISATVDSGASSVVSLLSRRGSERVGLVSGLAELFVSGVGVSWQDWCAGGSRVDLPTYAFQHERFWLAPSRGGDAASLGQGAARHPVLGAVVVSPGSAGVVLTGLVSRSAQPWLADHVVLGRVLMPASGWVELAVRAGDEVGCPVVRELAVTAPLVVPERGGLQVHVVVGEPDEAGARTVEIHSRPQADNASDSGWTLHAQGVLVREADSAPTLPAEVWPSADAQSVDVDAAYEAVTRQGYGYGRAFRGVRGVWRRGREVFAEVSVPGGVDVEGFGIHPALLDAVVHAPLLAEAAADPEADEVQVPFLWEGMSLHAVGASTVRVRISPAGDDAVAVQVTDETGALVLTVDSLVTRPVSQQALATAASAVSDGLFQLGWSSVSVDVRDSVSWARWEDVDTESAPAVVVWEWTPRPEVEVVEAVHAATHQALEVLQSWLSSAVFAGSRLVVVTRGAVALLDEQVVDVAGAAVWGLVRSAQAENPGRIVLVDTDTDLAASLDVADMGEPQLVMRGGVAHVARLTRAAATGEERAAGLAGGAVIVTGGTGGVGGVLARRLVEAHGVGCVVLASRRGPAADGAAELVAELEAAGAVVRVVACDVSDRSAVADLVASVPTEFELRGVVHAAGVLDDGVIGSLTPERMDRVLAAKADAAWFLHEATAEQELTLFAVVSSLSGVLGAPGQGNYAAANTFLDALAVYRRSLGLAGQSVSWGLWAESGGMGARLGVEGVGRMRASGVLPLTVSQAVELFDAAISASAEHLVAVRWDMAALRRQAGTGELAPVMADLVPAVRRTAAAGESVSQLVSRLRGLDQSQRRRRLLELVSVQVATVLGHERADVVGAETPFKDLGLDSLGGVQVRNRLQAATDLSLPVSLVFDYPTPAALAEHLLEQLLPGDIEPVIVARPVTKAVDDDPVVVVGMGCRYPGGVTSPEELWALVCAEGEGIGPFPSDRGWDVESVFDPDPDAQGKSYVRHGGFLDDVAGFDAGFFGVSPREAVAMDPQQRLLLEVSWEAIERAGIDPLTLRGSRTGVFAGVMGQDYAQLGNGASDDGEGFGTGVMGSVVSGRVSYVLGLEGPAVSVDTACSSSLVALHLAAQALRGGECDLALAGGVTVMATPDTFVEFSRQRGLAVDGRCKAFAESADGTGWAEGAGVLLLERLSDARRAGRRVLAVVAGSAVNQDGASNGLTAPNGPSQQRVIRAALDAAGVGAGDVDVVEAHGTGTVLGDPIEAQALLATYGRDRSVGGEPLWLGSLKSNVGHTQAAAGVGGVIKMVQALRHGVLPKTLHVDAPSSRVDWTAGQVALLRETRPWPDVPRPRRAGVSSFGLSGTNAHVIIEQAPPEDTTQTSTPSPSPDIEEVEP
ncbi:SDR family NAD(P)-dependent oxidoreductase, partial [Actinomadura latina]